MATRGLERMPLLARAGIIGHMHATVGSHLEADRLRRRTRQIERVIAALRDRAAYRRRVTGAAPAAMDRAIADFDTELAAARNRMDELERRST
jgi:hypothetical protein